MAVAPGGLKEVFSILVLLSMSVKRKVTVPEGKVIGCYVIGYFASGVRVMEAMNQRGARELKLPSASMSGLQSSGSSVLQGIMMWP